MKFIKTIAFLFALVVTTQVFARAGEIVLNLINEPIVTNSGKALSQKEARALIKKTAEARKWTVTTKPDGDLMASLSWNHKHTMVVDIAVTNVSYTLRYKDSVNLNYDGEKIHPAYNKYVRELKDAIRVDLLVY